ncbi:MAG: hypothetical protein FWH20_06040 [Oscillospiraceae bacterium]|nr:hypothetical protein [Oscillospiraceae bacterium]
MNLIFFNDSVNPQNDKTDIFCRCLQIANSIVKGDNIPPKDNTFLYENNCKMYMKAWSYREAVVAS